jgi:hypothetical protein
LLLATPLILLGVASAYFQLQGQRRLQERTHIPSDEFAYLRNRYRRRLLAAGLMILAGSMIAAAYLSGMEAKADSLKAATGEDGAKKPINDEDKQFVRLWGVYWIAVILQAFALVCIAITDAWATRRYWLSVYRAMKEDHEVKLRRDLAVYKQSRDDRGAQRGKL